MLCSIFVFELTAHLGCTFQRARTKSQPHSQNLYISPYAHFNTIRMLICVFQSEWQICVFIEFFSCLRNSVYTQICLYFLPIQSTRLSFYRFDWNKARIIIKKEKKRKKKKALFCYIHKSTTLNLRIQYAHTKISLKCIEKATTAAIE